MLSKEQVELISALKKDCGSFLRQYRIEKLIDLFRGLRAYVGAMPSQNDVKRFFMENLKAKGFITEEDKDDLNKIAFIDLSGDILIGHISFFISNYPYPWMQMQVTFD